MPLMDSSVYWTKLRKESVNLRICQQKLPKEDVTIHYMHAPNKRESKYVRQKLIKLQGEMDKSIVVLEI